MYAIPLLLHTPLRPSCHAHSTDACRSPPVLPTHTLHCFDADCYPDSRTGLEEQCGGRSQAQSCGGGMAVLAVCFAFYRVVHFFCSWFATRRSHSWSAVAYYVEREWRQRRSSHHQCKRPPSPDCPQPPHFTVHPPITHHTTLSTLPTARCHHHCKPPTLPRLPARLRTSPSISSYHAPHHALNTAHCRCRLRRPATAWMTTRSRSSYSGRWLLSRGKRQTSRCPA
jgi:hypothetical protein